MARANALNFKVLILVSVASALFACHRSQDTQQESRARPKSDPLKTVHSTTQSTLRHLIPDLRQQAEEKFHELTETVKEDLPEITSPTKFARDLPRYQDFGKTESSGSTPVSAAPSDEEMVFRKGIAETLIGAEEAVDALGSEAETVMERSLTDQDDIVRCLAHEALEWKKTETRNRVTSLRKNLGGDDFWLRLFSGYVFSPLEPATQKKLVEVTTAVMTRRHGDMWWASRLFYNLMRMEAADISPAMAEVVHEMKSGFRCDVSGALSDIRTSGKVGIAQLSSLLSVDNSCVRRYGMILLGLGGRNFRDAVLATGRCLGHVSQDDIMHMLLTLRSLKDEELPWLESKSLAWADMKQFLGKSEEFVQSKRASLSLACLHRDAVSWHIPLPPLRDLRRDFLAHFSQKQEGF